MIYNKMHCNYQISRNIWLVFVVMACCFQMNCTTLIPEQGLTGDEVEEDQPGNNVEIDTYSLSTNTYLLEEAIDSKVQLFDEPILHIMLYEAEQITECPPKKIVQFADLEEQAIDTPLMGVEMELEFGELKKDVPYLIYAYVQNENVELSLKEGEGEAIVAGCSEPIFVENDKGAKVTSVTVEVALRSLFKNISGDFTTMFQVDYGYNGEELLDEESVIDELDNDSPLEEPVELAQEEVQDEEDPADDTPPVPGSLEDISYRNQVLDSIKNDFETMVSSSIINAMFKFYSPSTREVRGFVKISGKIICKAKKNV